MSSTLVGFSNLWVDTCIYANKVNRNEVMSLIQVDYIGKVVFKTCILFTDKVNEKQKSMLNKTVSKPASPKLNCLELTEQTSCQVLFIVSLFLRFGICKFPLSRSTGRIICNLRKIKMVIGTFFRMK